MMNFFVICRFDWKRKDIAMLGNTATYIWITSSARKPKHSISACRGRRTPKCSVWVYSSSKANSFDVSFTLESTNNPSISGWRRWFVLSVFRLDPSLYPLTDIATHRPGTLLSRWVLTPRHATFSTICWKQLAFRSVVSGAIVCTHSTIKFFSLRSIHWTETLCWKPMMDLMIVENLQVGGLGYTPSV